MRTPTGDLSDGPAEELGRDQPVFGPEIGEFEHSERRAAQADGEGEMKTGTHDGRHQDRRRRRDGD